MGTILEAAVRKSGYPISKLAKRIGYTRQHIYNLFQQEVMDMLLLEEVGKIIGHDFSEEIIALGKYNKHEEILPVKEAAGPGYETLKKKYKNLLEEHNRALKEHNKLLKEYHELLKNQTK